jgi:hypothetical protein
MTTEFVGEELISRLNVTQWRAALRSQKRHCFFEFTDEDTLAMLDPTHINKDLLLKDVYEDACDYLIDKMKAQWELDNMHAIKYDYESPRPFKFVTKTVGNTTFLAVQYLDENEVNRIARSLYNHRLWPSPRAQQYAKAIGKKRLKHSDAIDYLAARATLTKEEFLKMHPARYLSLHGMPRVNDALLHDRRLEYIPI